MVVLLVATMPLTQPLKARLQTQFEEKLDQTEQDDQIIEKPSGATGRCHMIAVPTRDEFLIEKGVRQKI